MSDNNNIVLCVDLDDTLIKTDALLESILLLLKKNPIYAFIVPFWFLKGKPYMKEMIYGLIKLDASLLPYNSEVIEYIKEQKAKGRRTCLVTASHISVAKGAADHTAIFDDIIATEKGVNVKSDKKREILNEKYGKGNWDYIGDSKADLNVWPDARKTLLVTNSRSFEKKVKSKFDVEKVFFNKVNKSKKIIKQIRVYQWVKNILIFLPLILAHQVSNSDKLINVVIAFFSFSISASFVYTINDLLDLESDRTHPRKKKRPFASGDLPIKLGFVLAPLLLIIGLGLSFYLPTNFQIILLIYLLLTTAYSFQLKRVAILDIIILAVLFTTRIVSGAFAAEVYLSMWILAFSMFFFLNLAVLKRYTELLMMKKQNKLETKGRGYHIEDMGLLLSVGPAAGFLAVMVFALYINSEQSTELYSNVQLLWLIAPILLYWIIRIWHLCVRGKMTDDPIVFTGKDKVSYIIGILIFVIATLSS